MWLSIHFAQLWWNLPISALSVSLLVALVTVAAVKAVVTAVAVAAVVVAAAIAVAVAIGPLVAVWAAEGGRLAVVVRGVLVVRVMAVPPLYQTQQHTECTTVRVIGTNKHVSCVNTHFSTFDTVTHDRVAFAIQYTYTCMHNYLGVSCVDFKIFNISKISKLEYHISQKTL